MEDIINLDNDIKNVFIIDKREQLIEEFLPVLENKRMKIILEFKNFR